MIVFYIHMNNKKNYILWKKKKKISKNYYFNGQLVDFNLSALVIIKLPIDNCTYLHFTI